MSFTQLNASWISPVLHSCTMVVPGAGSEVLMRRLAAITALALVVALVSMLSGPGARPETLAQSNSGKVDKVKPADDVSTHSWTVIETSLAVIRLNKATGHSDVLKIEEGESRWERIAEPRSHVAARERRMIAFTQNQLSGAGDKKYKVHVDALEDFGVLKDDHIVAVDGNRVDSLARLANAISQGWHSDARRVTLRVERFNCEFDLVLRADGP